MTWWHVLAFAAGVGVGVALVFVWIWMLDVSDAAEAAGGGE